MQKVFLNDKLLDMEQASVSINDSSFLYGAGLFETMRAYNGRVFRLEEHLKRLFSSIEALGIKNTYNKDYIEKGIYEVLRVNELTQARIRLTLTNGSVNEGEYLKPVLLITATKLVPYPQEYYDKGVLVILSACRQNPLDPVYGHKTTSYFSRIIALNNARLKNATESLWFTFDGKLAEGCISNVFIVKDSVLYTPKSITPIIPGVMRKTILELAGENSIKAEEKDLTIDDVLSAEEIFLTNVVMQILPVSMVEKHEVSNAKPGEITKKLQNLFKEYIEKIMEI